MGEVTQQTDAGLRPVGGEASGGDGGGGGDGNGDGRGGLATGWGSGAAGVVPGAFLKKGGKMTALG